MDLLHTWRLLRLRECAWKCGWSRAALRLAAIRLPPAPSALRLAGAAAVGARRSLLFAAAADQSGCLCRHLSWSACAWRRSQSCCDMSCITTRLCLCMMLLLCLSVRARDFSLLLLSVANNDASQVWAFWWHLTCKACQNGVMRAYTPRCV